jgi:hypothetical protein
VGKNRMFGAEEWSILVGVSRLYLLSVLGLVLGM